MLGKPGRSAGPSAGHPADSAWIPLLRSPNTRGNAGRLGHQPPMTNDAGFSCAYFDLCQIGDRNRGNEQSRPTDSLLASDPHWITFKKRGEMSEQFESRWASSRKMLFAGSTAAALAAALLAGAPAFAGTPAVAPIGAVVLTDDPTDDPDPTDTDVWVPETPVDGKTTDGSESDVEPTAPAEPETPVQVPDGHGGYSIKYAITTNG